MISYICPKMEPSSDHAVAMRITGEPRIFARVGSMHECSWLLSTPFVDQTAYYLKLNQRRAVFSYVVDLDSEESLDYINKSFLPHFVDASPGIVIIQ